jgi:hypothetical protein
MKSKTLCPTCGHPIKQAKINNDADWIYIPELQVYVEKEVHHKDHSYDQLKEIYGKDFEKMLLTKSQVEVLDASKTYRKIFKMRTWNNDFYIQQYNSENKKQGYVAGFCSGGGGSGFGSGWYSDCAYSYRGVRFVRKKISKRG